MRIESIESHLLRLPLPHPIQSASSRGRKLDSIVMLVVFLKSDAEHTGMGYAWTLQGGGRAMKTIVDDDLGPSLLGEDPMDHERLWNQLYWQMQSVGRHGLVIQAQSALDLALWDLKGKAAGLPLWKLLGGRRPSAPAYGSDGGWIWMSVEEMLAAARGYLEQGLRGIKLKVGLDDPAQDLARMRQMRKALGDDVWIAVDANQKWDFPTALRMGREFEQLGFAWFEEPMLCEDPEGHARLAEKLDIPIALGETLASRYEIAAYLRRDAVDVVQPDLCRVGGITEFLRIATLADAAHRPVEPHLMMETSVHLACALPGIGRVEYMPWLSAAFDEPLRIENGLLLPPDGPGLGLSVPDAVVEQYHCS